MELLKELTMINSVSGNENAIAEFIKNEVSEYCDDVTTDVMGNLIAHKKGNGQKMAISSHMDEIGIIVTFVDDKGFIRFSQVGGLSVRELVGRRVAFDNGAVGVIGIHGDVEKIKLSELFVDVGDNFSKISVGDTAAFVGEFYECGDTIISKALDNRAGCYVAIEALKKLSDSDNDLFFIFSSQEEVGTRGAKTAIFDLYPDYALAIDVTDTGDTPNAPFMSVKLGCGCCIKVMDRSFISSKDVRERLLSMAQKKGISYQLEVMTEGGTDGGAMQLSGSGVKTGGISIPTRYIHSPSEMISKKDLEGAIALLTEFCK